VAASAGILEDEDVAPGRAAGSGPDEEQAVIARTAAALPRIFM
jgi:hypothetical protein